MSGPDLEAPDAPPVIDTALVRRLVDAQFPQWRDLPITPVEHDGWDNRTFRLGSELSVRLPSAAGYTGQVAKEHEWLPRLASRLPLPIPQPVAAGAPGEGYPFPWSVYRWLPGRPLALAREEADEVEAVTLARDIGAFLVALRGVDATDGPAPGTHNFFRGAPPDIYGEEALAAIALLGDDEPAARDIWERATASHWEAAPVWFHGDVAEGNLLVDSGRLSAVIDFGTSGVGDPACDLVPAWTMFDDPARTAFRAAVALDDATWARARGWALWKAAITLRDRPADPGSRTTLRRLLADPA
ncbi:aminoglycoside phosphotransferase family protein [Leifsonia naganoensis]|uniref:Aminoglycoside phosphotransferase (APT) family kinase protein n=1 Tax=Leifsonia naganoensis TaxID=150025 RepID=A0A853DPD9_9MICO|nr:aminoglycoside phosphotransferase family protein [Leifsonia naganoensis]NYK10992.1 aminoglycoside phosphotransferase (APT) family kinase protein [Leifsonia naganoensis]